MDGSVNVRTHIHLYSHIHQLELCVCVCACEQMATRPRAGVEWDVTVILICWVDVFALDSYKRLVWLNYK